MTARQSVADKRRQAFLIFSRLVLNAADVGRGRHSSLKSRRPTFVLQVTESKEYAADLPCRIDVDVMMPFTVLVSDATHQKATGLVKPTSGAIFIIRPKVLPSLYTLTTHHPGPS